MLRSIDFYKINCFVYCMQQIKINRFSEIIKQFVYSKNTFFSQYLYKFFIWLGAHIFAITTKTMNQFFLYAQAHTRTQFLYRASFLSAHKKMILFQKKKKEQCQCIPRNYHKYRSNHSTIQSSTGQKNQPTEKNLNKIMFSFFFSESWYTRSSNTHKK